MPETVITDEQILLLLFYNFHRSLSSLYISLYSNQVSKTPFIVVHKHLHSEAFVSRMIRISEEFVREKCRQYPVAFQPKETRDWVGFELQLQENQICPG